MRLAVVVQRYGAGINGGAELHARYVAEHLAPYAAVEVLTTCARDYVTWKNEFPAGTEQINTLNVLRFPVDHPRDVRLFAQQSDHVFEHWHSHNEELAWLDSEGPASSALLRYIRANRQAYDYFIFFSYRYHHAYHGAGAVPDRAVLVPTAERDEAIGVSLFQPLFRSVRALMYNSPEERAMIQSAADNTDVPGIVVGIGSDIPERPEPERFRRKFSVTGRFALYVGRIDRNKGCKELFAFFLDALPALPGGLSLVLIGQALLPIPDHPRIRHLGFLSDEDKFDAIAAAELLIMPSYFESLSMVALEAWALGRPVLANGRCEVLRGQCLRSAAGLYYENQAEFIETLRAIVGSRTLNAAFGANGRDFYREHYAWPVIERKYLDTLAHLQEADRAERERKAPEPAPGWLARRRRSLPPARDVLAALPERPIPPTSGQAEVMGQLASAR